MKGRHIASMLQTCWSISGHISPVYIQAICGMWVVYAWSGTCICIHIAQCLVVLYFPMEPICYLTVFMDVKGKKIVTFFCIYQLQHD